MKILNTLDYLKLTKSQALWYDVRLFFSKIPSWFKGLFVKLWAFIKKEKRIFKLTQKPLILCLKCDIIARR